MAGTTLTEAQIDQLLADAEARLTAQCKEKTLTLPTKGEVVAKSESRVIADSTSAASAAKPKDDYSVRLPQPRLSKAEYLKQTKATAGASWFDLPKTDLTPELKRDLQLLKMRGTLDAKRHYRKDTSTSVPEYSHVGTLVEGPTEFFSARMTKKERKRTLLDEVLQTEDTTRKFKSKYGEIQSAKTSGKKGHYKKMMQKRYGSKK